MTRTPGQPVLARAFTLVEILIVVVILGILAAVVVPSFANATEPSRQTAFITNMKSFADAAQLVRIRNGTYPPDSSSGVMPDELIGYIAEEDWNGGTPIGGVWDSEDTDLGYGIGIHFDGTGETRDEIYMAQIDEIFDDGDLEAGAFQNTGDGRYYLIIEAN